MDPLVIQLVVLIVLLILSAFFSSAETALSTVNKVRMRALAEEGDVRAKRVLRIADDYQKMLADQEQAYFGIWDEIKDQYQKH